MGLALGVLNVMGALLTIGTVLIVPAFGAESLSRRGKVNVTATPRGRGGDVVS